MEANYAIYIVVDTGLSSKIWRIYISAQIYIHNTGKHQIVFLTGFTILSNFRVTESETGFHFSLLVRFQKL